MKLNGLSGMGGCYGTLKMLVLRCLSFLVDSDTDEEEGDGLYSNNIRHSASSCRIIMRRGFDGPKSKDKFVGIREEEKER